MPQERQGTKTGSGFRLVKWFLDVLTEQGECFILYAATLEWMGVRVPYNSLMHFTPGSGTESRSRFRNTVTPKEADKDILFTDDTWEISGRWTPRSSPLSERLFEIEGNSLDWFCLQPSADVTLEFRGRQLRGSGYAEKLVLEIPPWKLPMQELRWGHCIAPGQETVWIEVREKELHQWVWHQGEKMPLCDISDDRIRIPSLEHEFALDRSVTLESEKKIASVVRSLLKFLPGFRQLVPLSLLMADEWKWLSRVKFQGRNGSSTEGLSVHELLQLKE